MADLQERTILLYAEQGLGDTLQFIRYGRLVKAWRQRARQLPGAAGAALGNLCGHRLPGDLRAEFPPFEVQAPLLSLLRILGTTLATVPADILYLIADEQLVAHRRRELSPVGAFNIGITCQGNPKYRGDRLRSIPLAQFAPLARLDGVQLFSLQKGPGTEQLHQGGRRFSDHRPGQSTGRNGRGLHGHGRGDHDCRTLVRAVRRLGL
jgi:hypothetical protein